jgi:transposase-like protein
MDTIALNSTRARRRRYSREFKAEIVEACKQPGTSVAAIARMHGMNDNVVHRWLREAELAGTDLWPTSPSPARLESVPAATSFVPIRVSPPLQEAIHLELSRNGLAVQIDWPASQATSCMQFLQELLR